MDMGTKEGQSADEAQQTIKDARLLQEALVKKGWKLGRDLKYFEAEGAEHNERAWAQRVEPILRFLFRRSCKIITPNSFNLLSRRRNLL